VTGVLGFGDVLSYSRGMHVKDVAQSLGVNEQRVHYLHRLLLKEDLIEPKRGLGNKWIFSEEDFKQFQRLQDLLNNGANTTGEAIRIMKNNVTPAEAIERYQQSQRQIEVLQQKVIQLRRGWWYRLWDWIRAKIAFTRG